MSKQSEELRQVAMAVGGVYVESKSREYDEWEAGYDLLNPKATPEQKKKARSLHDWLRSSEFASFKAFRKEHQAELRGDKKIVRVGPGKYKIVSDPGRRAQVRKYLGTGE
jgi:hypothetical protein